MPSTATDPAHAVSVIKGASRSKSFAVVSHVKAIKGAGVVLDMTNTGVATDVCQPSIVIKDGAGTRTAGQ